MKKWQIIEKLGGPGSGNHGHRGVPGQRGGSAPSSGGLTDVGWAKGVRAAKDLGGQVPIKSVKKADKILQKEGLKPTTRKAPKTYKDIENFYETTRPIPGDIWEAKGVKAEIGKIVRSGSGGSMIDIHIMPSKGMGRTSSLYTKKDWTT